MTDSKIQIDKDIMVSFAKEAYSNIGLSLKEISTKILQSETDNQDDLLQNVLLNNSNQLLPEQKASLQKLLIKTFPSVRITLDHEVASLSKRDKVILASYPHENLIDVLRKYIHTVNCIQKWKIEDIDPKIIIWLIYILKCAKNTIRSNYKYDAFKNIPSLLPENALAFFSSSMYIKKDRKGKPTINPSWFFNPGEELSNKSISLSVIGIIELISLFLSPDRVYEFLHKTKILSYFRGLAEKPSLSQQQIVHALLSCFSIRIPKHSQNIVKCGTGNALEIIHHLRKCPEELYHVLPPDKQAEFHLFDNNRKVFWRRTSDCFPTFVIRYFDNNNSFNKIRFGLHLGYTSRFSHIKNDCADGKERNRYFKENINVFSSIDDAISCFASLSKQLDNVHEERFSFVRNGENFAISIGDKMPFIKDKSVKCHQPDCWISKYELDAMAFYDYLRPGDAERIILDEIKKYKSSNREKRKQRQANDIKDYILKETYFLLDNLEKKKRIINRGNTKVGSKKYCRFMANDIAAFLIKDIVFWMESENRSNSIKKPSGLQYAIVKGMLSNFDGVQYKKEDLLDAFNRIRVDVNSHVILKKINDYNSILDFYEKYLLSRHDFLSNYKSIKFLERKIIKHTAPNDYHQPILLPRGIFIKHIMTALEEDYENNPKLKTILDKMYYEQNNSLSCLVKAYYETVMNDQSQSMYLCHRRDQYGYFRLLSKNPLFANKVNLSEKDREIIRQLKGERVKLQTVPDYNTFMKELSISKKHMKSTEKSIRRHRTNDMILFLLAKRQLSKEGFDLQLQDITPDGTSLKNIVTQEVSANIGNRPNTIYYTSSIKDSYLIFKYLFDPKLQTYINQEYLEKNKTITISSDKIKELFDS